MHTPANPTSFNIKWDFGVGVGVWVTACTGKRKVHLARLGLNLQIINIKVDNYSQFNPVVHVVGFPPYSAFICQRRIAFQ